ncbi:MAG: NADP-dependent phosphogluconate dehydrogenase [Planctomycetes bacterium]|nr:NADP-dependent phosphogluconate dehydrogenase [Planctomycetota bacterium]
MNQVTIGLIGLAVMGENLALNIAEKGFRIAVGNRTADKVDRFFNERAGQLADRIVPCRTFEELAKSLEAPRRIILMIKAGAPVDQLIEQLAPLLSKGDILIDAGNSLFTDTERRLGEMAARGLRFIGMGVSGGEEGARHGPSLMPGGDPEAVGLLLPVLEKIAAQVDDGPCASYIGRGGSGHYVKMVHNGIEYGDMQLICEAYDLLKSIAGLSCDELSGVFGEWNRGELSSFLIEITAAIFKKRDPDTGKPLVEVILDKAGQKGTGKWTSQNALDVGASIPTITAAVEARILSSLKEERAAAAKLLAGPSRPFNGDRKAFIGRVRDALYLSKICSYAQGMALLSRASGEYKYGLNLSELARIWKGGCIIRARLLDRIAKAYRTNPGLKNLLLDPEFKAQLESKQEAWREVVAAAVQHGIAVPAMADSLGYFDSYRRERLPANLLQAQRDFFGAHTYERTDKPGVFHTEWS